MREAKCLQNERIVKYFLIKEECDRYKIMISKQTDDKDTEVEIDKLFRDSFRFD